MEETAKKLRSSVESVISNDDLLTEILVRLPVLSLVYFKSVSKRWLSLIKDASVTFRPNLDPISGLFLKKYSSKEDYSESYSYDFLPLDIRIPICRSSFTFDPVVRLKRDVEILHSCNGLLLFCKSGNIYVYNPSITNMFKLIPEPDNVTRYNNTIVGLNNTIMGLNMAFDPTKSPHYKVIYAKIVHDDPDHNWVQIVNDDPYHNWVQIHTYSSETGNWNLCGHQFPERSFFWFKYGVYWNDAIYWLNHESRFFKLDIMNEHPVLTALQTSLTLDRKECRLFESRGCLLLVVKNDAHSRHFTIYEKGNMYSEWSVKYIVNLDDTIKLFSKRWSIYNNIFCIVLGEREEDSFLVMELDRKVVQYKIVSKTLNTISDVRPKEYLVECFQFIPSFANV